MSKQCSKCKDTKTLDHFMKRKDSKDGYRNMCKACMPKYQYDVPTEGGPKICATCKIEKPFVEFYLTLDNICKVCQLKRNAKYRNTLNGTLRTLLNSARNRVKDRKGNSAMFDLTFEDMNEMFERQAGLCYYSNITMAFQGEFMMSLERLDNEQGYIKSNVVLICLELNSSLQWTLEKITEMIQILDKNIKKNNVNFDKKTTCIRKDTPYDKKEYNESPRAKLKSLYNSAKQRVIRKNRNLGFDIDFDFLINLFNTQKGLCAYSGMPLQFKDNWLISLERIDVYKGYMKDNVCFICMEYNSIDRSATKKIKTETSTGWNKNKFEFFLQSVREFNVTQMLEKTSI